MRWWWRKKTCYNGLCSIVRVNHGYKWCRFCLNRNNKLIRSLFISDFSHYSTHMGSFSLLSFRRRWSSHLTVSNFLLKHIELCEPYIFCMHSIFSYWRMYLFLSTWDNLSHLNHHFVGGANTELLRCPFPGQYWNAYSCSFSLEPHRYITGCCYNGNYHKNIGGYTGRERIRLQQ